METDILDHSLSGIARRFAQGEVTAGAICDAALARRQPELDAYVAWLPDFARAQARAADAAQAAGAHTGGLMGVPVSVKDIYGLSGFPTLAGTPRPLPAPWNAEGPLIGALRRQFGMVMGKTHTVEFAYGGLGTSGHHPVPRNPRDPAVHRAPGGSSSGAGVSIVEGTALVAFGTDTGGSVRIPASLTGTFGLKTTRGRWSCAGIVPLSPTFDTPGILTRSAADAAFAFEHLDGARVPALADGAALRLGIAQAHFWDDCSPGIAEVVRSALNHAEAGGARLCDRALPGAEEAHTLYRQGGIVSAELYSFLRRDLPDWLETLDPDVRRRMERGAKIEAVEFLERKSRYESLARAAPAAFDAADALVAPTVPLIAPPVADLADPETYTRLNMQMVRNTCAVNFMGLCAVTMPAGLDGVGMPVGLQLIGPPMTEPRLLAIARWLEARLDRAGQWRPPHRPD